VYCSVRRQQVIIRVEYGTSGTAITIVQMHPTQETIPWPVTVIAHGYTGGLFILPAVPVGPYKIYGVTQA
jgi:hypothetical protein